MKQVEVSKIIEPMPASDGAGVKLKRSIGVEPNYFDPFLMLDEFGSENKDDYIGGFPPHPHRGIETVTYMLAGEFEVSSDINGDGELNVLDIIQLINLIKPLYQYLLTRKNIKIIYDNIKTIKYRK